MPLSQEKKSGVMSEFRRGPSDTGSPEVQIALLSERISGLGQHFASHAGDHSSRRGLVKLVNQRRKLLDYLGPVSRPNIRKSSSASDYAAKQSAAKAAPHERGLFASVLYFARVTP